MSRPESTPRSTRAILRATCQPRPEARGPLWVSLGVPDFEACMKYLDLHDYQVIALRDLENYVDHEVQPENHMEIIESRQRQLQSAETDQPPE